MSCGSSGLQKDADVAQQVEHLIGNEEVRQFESARQLHVAMDFAKQNSAQKLSGILFYSLFCQKPSSGNGLTRPLNIYSPLFSSIGNR